MTTTAKRYRVLDQITGETYEGEDLYTIIRSLFWSDDRDILESIRTLVDAYEAGEYYGWAEAYLGVTVIE